MHEQIFAGFRGDEAVALVGVEPFHGSNRHVLVPPSIVSEVSTNTDATLTPTARDKRNLQVAKQCVSGRCISRAAWRWWRPLIRLAVDHCGGEGAGAAVPGGGGGVGTAGTAGGGSLCR